MSFPNWHQNLMVCSMYVFFFSVTSYISVKTELTYRSLKTNLNSFLRSLQLWVTKFYRFANTSKHVDLSNFEQLTKHESNHEVLRCHQRRTSTRTWTHILKTHQQDVIRDPPSFSSLKKFDIIYRIAQHYNITRLYL